MTDASVMRVLITGAGGQLARALMASVPPGVKAHAAAIDELDICNTKAIDTSCSTFRPTHIFNAAAYTAVDRAEQDADLAYAVNATAVGHLADAAMKYEARLVHVSTDFVFDGRSGSPYAPDAPRAPSCVYGATKAAGEDAAGPDTLIVRTAWVYDAIGPNFVQTMLRLMRERSEVRVVADQIGTPTSAATLADAIWRLNALSVQGIYHVTDSGSASWYDFAVAIKEEAVSLGLIDNAVSVIPIATSDYPTPAARPAYSVLDKRATVDLLGHAPHWRDALRKVMQSL